MSRLRIQEDHWCIEIVGVTIDNLLHQGGVAKPLHDDHTNKKPNLSFTTILVYKP
jgi:hypothetical protein